MEAYRCADATAGAAVWLKTTLTIDELGTGALRTIDAATAENDMLVAGSSPFSWVKKTLAEVRTLLGLDGATTEILVGGGTGTAPVWTEATGSGAPVRAVSPTLVTPALGTPASGDLQNCSISTTTEKGVTVYSGSTKALAGTDTASAMTPADVAAANAVLAREPDQGVAMTYAASGSTGITVADNDNIDMGTGNFAPYFCGIIPDVTPTTDIILAQKHDGTNGWILTLLTTGYLRTTINAATYDSTATLASMGVVDGANVKILSGITRETASVAGSVQHYVNGLALGASVAITAGAPTTVNNAVSLYVLGTSAVRTAGIANTFVLFNRCPTAAEVLDLYRNGIAEADKWGSQVSIITGTDSDFSGAGNWTPVNDGTVLINAGKLEYSGATNPFHGCGIVNKLTIGKRYRTVLDVSDLVGGTSIRVDQVGDQNSPIIAGINTVEFTATDTLLAFYSGIGTGTTAWKFDNVYLYELGATLALENGGFQPAPGQCFDSAHSNHAMQPATGSSLTRYKKDFEYRWTNTWTASSAAQYVGGLNQAVLSADHFITDIITQATETTDVKNLELGDGSAVAKFVAAFTPSATRTSQTIAAQNDGTNLKLVYTPAAEATMTVETIIRGFIWEP